MLRLTRPQLIIIFILALGLTFFRVPLASSQGTTILAAAITDELPTTDPDAAVWGESTAVEVPLSAQVVARPILPETQVKSITVRALHNGSRLAILTEWLDETQDDQMIRVQDFRDSVAVQFALTEGEPFFCMGQPGGDVNIWHWKADWQADIAARQDMESLYPDMFVDLYPFADAAVGVMAGPLDYEDPNYLPALVSGNLFARAAHLSPVEDLVAGGFGSLTSQPADGQNVQGFGAWSQGKWRVIFSRNLTSAEAEDVVFSPGTVHPIAFAAWDGANGERDGQKSTSQWVSMQLAGVSAAPGQEVAVAPGLSEGYIFVVIPMVGTLVLILLLVSGTALAAGVLRRRS